MRHYVIGTGSTGNAVLLEDRVMVDIGLPWSRIEPHADKLQLVLATHRHSDHWNPATVRALHRARPGVRFGCCEWMLPLAYAAGLPEWCVDLYQLDTPYTYGDITVMAQETPHNVRNCCYHIQIGAQRCLYATDCSSLGHVSAKGYDLLAIEANHGQEEIQERIRQKQAAGVYAYEVEAARNHLSEEQAMDWIAANAEYGKTSYVLLHRHVERELEV